MCRDDFFSSFNIETILFSSILYCFKKALKY